MLILNCKIPGLEAGLMLMPALEMLCSSPKEEARFGGIYSWLGQLNHACRLLSWVSRVRLLLLRAGIPHAATVKGGALVT